MVALFRITELRHGSIVIDGQDISKLGLNTLRSALSIIPQVKPAWVVLSGCISVMT